MKSLKIHAFSLSFSSEKLGQAQLVAELALKNRVLKRSLTGLDSEWDA